MLLFVLFYHSKYAEKKTNSTNIMNFIMYAENNYIIYTLLKIWIHLSLDREVVKTFQKLKKNQTNEKIKKNR